MFLAVVFKHFSPAAELVVLSEPNIKIFNLDTSNGP